MSELNDKPAMTDEAPSELHRKLFADEKPANSTTAEVTKPPEKAVMGFAWRSVIGFGFAAFLAGLAYYAGTRRSLPGPTSDSAELQALRSKARSLEIELADSKRQINMAAAREQIAKTEQAATQAQGKDAERLRAEIKTLQEVVARQSAEIRRQQGLIASATGAGRRMARVPDLNEDDPLAPMNENPTQLDGSSPAKDAPFLIAPSPASPALLVPPQEFTFQFPPGKLAHEAGLWEYNGSELRRGIRVETKTVGTRLTLRVERRLAPGRYVVGIRQLEPDAVVPDSERLWHAFKVTVLSGKELADRDAALKIAPQAPTVAAGLLFRNGCYDDAKRVLQSLPSSPRTDEALKGLERWIALSRNGQSIRVPSELRAGLDEDQTFAEFRP